jgi:hypothetical protein
MREFKGDGMSKNLPPFQVSEQVEASLDWFPPSLRSRLLLPKTAPGMKPAEID